VSDDLLTSRLRVPDYVVHRSFEEETVVLNLDSGVYHGLNPTATKMLEQIDKSDSVADAVDVLAAEFGQPRERIESDVVALCQALEERGLILRA
jgi:hypothetical protein